jgi:NAD+ synthase (glutamine-hydrolysing)
MKDGFIKIACATPDLKVGDCDYNTDKIIEMIKEACSKGVKIICLPDIPAEICSCSLLC